MVEMVSFTVYLLLLTWLHSATPSVASA